ncbi:MAG: IS3 family transposase [Bacteroidales bacterium]|nr:IS3 family transposase [Bacteroidales bacterium]
MQCLIYLKKKHSKLSHSHACKMLGCTRTTLYYKKKMPLKDENIKAVIKQVLGNSRKGRNKVIRLVRKKHPQYGVGQIRRVYEQSGFSLSKKLRRRIKDNPANPIEIPFACNEEWAMDFMSDALLDGRKIRSLNIIDHYNRECKGIKIGFSIPARILINYLEQRIEIHGKPKRIRTDNGPEFRSKLFQKWLKNNGIDWSRIQKGKPQQNAIIERFNKTYREDVLDANIFHTVAHAEDITNEWIMEYNNERPHQSLNFQTPIEYAA